MCIEAEALREKEPVFTLLNIYHNTVELQSK